MSKYNVLSSFVEAETVNSFENRYDKYIKEEKIVGSDFYKS